MFFYMPCFEAPWATLTKIVLSINGHDVRVCELADRLVCQMDLVFFADMNASFANDNEDDGDSEWRRVLFVNALGVMDGGSNYCMVMSGAGSAWKARSAFGCATSRSAAFTTRRRRSARTSMTEARSVGCSQR